MVVWRMPNCSASIALTERSNASWLVRSPYAPSTPTIAIGAMVFAVGAGLTAIVRPYLIQSVFSIERAGHLSGRVARQQQLARAAGPIVTALLASWFTYALVLAALAVAFVMVMDSGRSLRCRSVAWLGPSGGPDEFTGLRSCAD
jgi:hypothetical protein